MSPEAEDERLLKHLSKKSSIIDNLLSEKEVKLLWEICSIPDYSKNFDDSHSELLEQIYFSYRYSISLHVYSLLQVMRSRTLHLSGNLHGH